MSSNDEYQQQQFNALNHGDKKNYEEDFSHENGKYMNFCSICSHFFIGHKRRVWCKECDNNLKKPTN